MTNKTASKIGNEIPMPLSKEQQEEKDFWENMSRSEEEDELSRVIVQVLMRNSFYGTMIQSIKKRIVTFIPTAAIGYDKKTDDVTLFMNPWFLRKCLKEQKLNVVCHEILHLALGHITTDRRGAKEYAQLENIAMDLAINDNLKREHERETETGCKTLPEGCVFPGEWLPHPGTGKEPNEKEKGSSKFAEAIAALPRDKSKEYYFDQLKPTYDELKEENKKNAEKALQDMLDKMEKEESGGDQPQDGDGGDGQSEGQNGEPQPGDGEVPGTGGSQYSDIDKNFAPMDSHDFWDMVPDEKKDEVKARVNDMVEGATKEANKYAHGWGNMSSEIREEIIRGINNSVDWRKVLRSFAGRMIRMYRSSSIKVIDRRFPWMHPGKKKGYAARILIAIDQSGSVSDNLLELIFAELASLNKRIEIDVVHFDYNHGEPYTWKRGQPIKFARTHAGGTRFDAVTELVTDVKNRGRWEGVFIATDGEAPAPGPIGIKRAWMLEEGDNLIFSTDELVLKIKDKRQ